MPITKRSTGSGSQRRDRGVRQLSDWLIDQGLLGGKITTVFESYCQRLRDLGLPLWRAHIAMRTLHPSYGSQTFTWIERRGIETKAWANSRGGLPEFAASPFSWMLRQGLTSAHWRLSGAEGSREFALFDELARGGATAYAAEIVQFADDGVIQGRTGMLASYCTREASGFSEGDRKILSRLNKRLALTVKALLNIDIARNILDTYIGTEAGRRVLAGEIHQGYHTAIQTVIYFADIRGFTTLTERLPAFELIPLLDLTMECMIKPVIEAGGHVLKFIGDGVLASFELTPSKQGRVTAAALRAALAALSLMDEANAKRANSQVPAITFDVALHVGEVLYGNVGAAERLDFTVIGPSVNEASRIEALCDKHGVHLLMSDVFARSLADSGGLRSIGEQSLRGSGRRRELFTWEDPLVPDR